MFVVLFLKMKFSFGFKPSWVILALAILISCVPTLGTDLRVIIEFTDPPALQGIPASRDSLAKARESIANGQAVFVEAAAGLIRPVPGRSAEARKVAAASTGQGPSDRGFPAMVGDYCAITDIFNGMAAVVSGDDIGKIRAMPGVKAVHLDKVVRACIAESVPLIGADQVWTITDDFGVAIRGKGVKVAILDTGIDYTHPDLGGGFGPSCKVIGGYDFVNYDFDPLDDNGHGTHVAGIIAASGKMTGVAPAVSLMAYKVLDKTGSGYSSDVVSAIGKAVSDGADVINISLGTMDDIPLTTAAENAVAMGVVVCAAAGNEGPTIRTINSPGDGPNVISVGACDEKKVIWNGSSRGPTSTGLLKPDIIAPGMSEIQSTYTYGIKSTYRGGSYANLTGTSMACPHVTGVCALVLQAAPTLTPAQVRKRLYDNAVDLGYPHMTQGYGLVDARAAVLNGRAAQPPTLSLSTPAAGGETVDLLAFINWIDSDPDSSASISLHYDMDGAGFDGTAIASGISEDSTVNQYIWNTSMVSEGVYYIYGVINDGVNPAVKIYAPGFFIVSHPPEITLETPGQSGTVAWKTFDARWTDHDSDDDAEIRFFADSDRGGVDGIPLPGVFHEDIEGDGDFATLDISGLASGIYYLYASISDGRNQIGYSYAPGPLIVNSPPAVGFVSPPAGIEVFAAGGKVEFSYTLEDRDDSAGMVLFVDSDSVGFDGVPISDVLQESVEPITLTWDMSDFPSGDYWIYSEASDGVNSPVKTYAPWVIIRNDPPQAVFLSPSSGDAVAAVTIRVGYILVDGDSVATASLFAYPEAWPAERTAISDIPIDETIDGEFIWDVSVWPSGRYGLLMVASDGLNQPVESFCPGIVVVDHLPRVNFSAVFPEPRSLVAGITFEVAVAAADDENPAPGISIYWDNDATGFDGVLLPAIPGKAGVYSTNAIVAERFRLYALADDGVNPAAGSYSATVFFKTRVGTISGVRLSNLASDRVTLSFMAPGSTDPQVEYRIICPFSEWDGVSPAIPDPSAIIRTSSAISLSAGVFEARLLDLLPCSTIGIRISIPSDAGPQCFPAKGELVFNTPDVGMHSISAYFRASIENPLNTQVFLEIADVSFGSSIVSSVYGKPDETGKIVIPAGPFFDRCGARIALPAGMIIRATIVSTYPYSSRVVEFPMPEIGIDADLGVLSLEQSDFQVISMARGWNLVALSLYPNPALTAGEFLNETGSLMLAAWDSSIQSYKAVFRGDSGFMGTDFQLVPGEGYFVKASAPVRMQIPGVKPVMPLAMQLSKGFNLVGSARPAGPFGGGSAVDLLGFEAGNIAIYGWSADTQTYDLVYKIAGAYGSTIFFGDDFPIAPGKGFFVKASAPGFYLDE